MRRQELSSNRIKGLLVRLAAALVAVGFLSTLSSLTPGAGTGNQGALALIVPALAQDQGSTNSTTNNAAPAAPDNGAGTGDQNNGAAAGGNNTVALGSSENVPVGINDILHVTVVGQPDLTNDYQVDNTGNITMPYIGNVHVGGLQVDQIAPIITKKLDTIYNNVNVMVTRHSVGGIDITLTGALAKQGSVLVRRDAHLNDVIQQAGPLSDSDLGHVTITRGMPGTPQTTLHVDYNSFLSTGDTDGNPLLADGDVIYVPHKSPVTVSVSITGDVGSPGRYDMPAGSTFFDLVSRAGGLTPRADRNSIYIQPIGTLTHQSVNYDQASSSPSDTTMNPVLKDGDKVVVPELPNQPSFSITGGVLSPGDHPLVGTVSLSDAIGEANGIQPRAHLNKTQITRRTPNGAEVLKVDASDPKVAGNFIVQPDDNIYIPPGSAPFQVNPFEIIGILISAYAVFH